jgi:hypothetical protein
VDRDEHIQSFDLHQEAVNFLLVAEGVVSVRFCILRRLVVSPFLFGLWKVQHEVEYRSLIANHEMALQPLKDRDTQDNLYRHCESKEHNSCHKRNVDKASQELAYIPTLSSIHIAVLVPTRPRI